MNQDVSIVSQHPLDLAIAGWLDAKFHRSKSKRTQGEYAETIRLFREGLRRLGFDLDSDVVAVSLVAQKFASFSTVPEKDVKPTTYNQRLAILSSFYEYARKHRFLADNPLDLVERAKVQSYAGARSLDASHVMARMRAIDRSTLLGARDYALLGVLLQTGRRLAEVAGLRWGDVVLQHGCITLTFHCKGDKTMYDTLPKPLSKAVLGWLRLLYGPELGTLDKDAPVWVNFARNQYHKQPLGMQSIADICHKRLGVSKVHVTRHTWAHNMVKAGATLNEIQARLGHESLATTGRYVAMLQSAENAYAETISELFGLDE